MAHLVHQSRLRAQPHDLPSDKEISGCCCSDSHGKSDSKRLGHHSKQVLDKGHFLVAANHKLCVIMLCVIMLSIAK